MAAGRELNGGAASRWHSAPDFGLTLLQELKARAEAPETYGIPIEDSVPSSVSPTTAFSLSAAPSPAAARGDVYSVTISPPPPVASGGLTNGKYIDDYLISSGSPKSGSVTSSPPSEVKFVDSADPKKSCCPCLWWNHSSQSSTLTAQGDGKSYGT